MKAGCHPICLVMVVVFVMIMVVAHPVNAKSSPKVVLCLNPSDGDNDNNGDGYGYHDNLPDARQVRLAEPLSTSPGEHLVYLKFEERSALGIKHL